MTSAINTGTINVNYPTPGVNNNSQGLRDNFAGTKDNLNIAASEITELQNKVLLKSAITGQTLNNDMNNGIIKNAQTLDFRASTYNLGTNSGTLNIDRTLGDVQYGTLAGSISLTFSKWAPTDTQSSVQVMLTVTAGQTITLPDSVTIGAETIEGYSLGTITVPIGITFLHYEFTTIDCGENIEIIPLNRPRVTGVNLSQIQNGDSNVKVLYNGDITISSNGAANVVVVSSNTVTVGNIVASGGLSVMGNTVMTGAVDLGNETNLRITGGSPNFVLATDGYGNVRWVSASASSNSFPAGLSFGGQLTSVGGSISANTLSITSSANVGGVSLAGGNITSGRITATGTLNLNGNAIMSGSANITGTITGGNIVSSGNVSVAGAIAATNIFASTLNGNLISNDFTPSSASGTGTKGQIAYDDNYIYVCVETNTWKRSALTTW